MGIKSSWPALAITHHLIVLYAAWLVGLDPLRFKDYLILGDDVVIANEKVAESYLKVTNGLEIPVGLAKSFAGAKGFFQFANQNWLNGVNISPVSLKADLAVQKPLGAIEFARQVISRWPSVSNSIVTRFVRILVDDGQYASISYEMKRWRFGATAGSIVRTLLTPGSPSSAMLGADVGASIYLWLTAISHGVSIREVNDLVDEKEGRERFALISQKTASPLHIELAVEQARSYISDVMARVIALREEVAPLKAKLGLWGFGYEAVGGQEAKVESLSYDMAELSRHLFDFLVPYLDHIRTSSTYGELVASFELLRQYVDSLPQLMTFKPRKEEAPSPWKVRILPRSLSPGILSVLKDHGIEVRRIPASVILQRAREERMERKKRLERKDARVARSRRPAGTVQVPL